ncbi:MAG: ATP-binding protein [Acidobacteriota bacterium]
MTLPSKGSTVSLRFNSAFEMLDLVQVVSDRITRMLEFEDDALVWMEVAVRESVINAIKHGNRFDTSKMVFVEFAIRPEHEPRELVVSIRDQGAGFDPDTLPDPLAPENLLKSSGRGIFFMRSFMDEVCIEQAAGGGTVVRLTKTLPGRA